MKKKSLLTILAVSMATMLTPVFSSCSKDDDESGSPTTYTFVYKAAGASYVDNVKLFEYTENGDKISNNTISSIQEGRKYDFTAADKAVKVKVYIQMGTTPRWIQQVFYLKIGSNTLIELNDKTVIGKNEP